MRLDEVPNGGHIITSGREDELVHALTLKCAVGNRYGEGYVAMIEDVPYTHLFFMPRLRYGAQELPRGVYLARPLARVLVQLLPQANCGPLPSSEKTATRAWEIRQSIGNIISARAVWRELPQARAGRP